MQNDENIESASIIPKAKQRRYARPSRAKAEQEMSGADVKQEAMKRFEQTNKSAVKAVQKVENRTSG
jgi:hypothetical protein